MLKHNLLIAFRNFKKYKSSFLINITGLSTGLVCVLFIYLWVIDEMTVDKFYNNDSQLYQVLQNYQEEGIFTSEYTPGILAEALTNEIAEIRYGTRVIHPSWFDDDEKGLISYGDVHLKAKGQYIDQSYFDVFPTKFSQGYGVNALEDKASIVISESLAEKLFGSIDKAMGKTFAWSQGAINKDFNIVGVHENQPNNATHQFDLLINLDVFFEEHDWLTNWDNSDPNTYVVLESSVDVDNLNVKLQDFITSKAPELNKSIFLQKFSDRYLKGVYENGMPSGGRIEYVKLFSLVAIFILLIACINFTTLATAQASRRQKEVGIKKAIGATRKALIYQFFGESMLITIISFGVAFLMILVFLPTFNNIMGKQLELAWGVNLVLPTLVILVLTGLTSGIYPAIYLSKFSPIKAIAKKNIPAFNSLKGLIGIKGLVVFQFVTSIILVTSVLVVYHQMKFIQSKNLGYERDNILFYTMPPNENLEGFTGETIEDRMEYVRKELESMETYLGQLIEISGVISATNFSHDLTGNHGDFSGVDWKEGDEDRELRFKNLAVGNGFIETFGIEMQRGRSLSQKYGTEQNRVLLNETAVKRMGLENPIGKTLRFWGLEKTVVGVTKDFHLESLYEPVKPCIIQLALSDKIGVKIQSGTEQRTISQLQDNFEAKFPGHTFDYGFVDDQYQALYQSETRASSLSKYFAGLAILISCLGLFGLAMFTTERRMKEIGIRKTLGAGVFGIIRLLSADFIRTVGLAILVALPISYFAANKWLESFAYHFELNWWVLLIPGAAVLLISWFIVGIQTTKAAVMNPTEFLNDD